MTGPLDSPVWREQVTGLLDSPVWREPVTGLLEYHSDEFKSFSASPISSVNFHADEQFPLSFFIASCHWARII